MNYIWWGSDYREIISKLFKLNICIVRKSVIIIQNHLNMFLFQ